MVDLFLASLGLHCGAWAFPSGPERGPLRSRGSRASHRGGGFSLQLPAPELGSAVAGHGLSCSAARGRSLHQGSKPCPCIGSWILTHHTTREVPESLSGWLISWIRGPHSWDAGEGGGRGVLPTPVASLLRGNHVSCHSVLFSASF